VTKRKLLHLWVRERDEVVKTYNIARFKEFYAKWRERGFYNLPLPSDAVIEISMRKMVYHMASATPEEKAEAERWLVEHGSSTDI